jgi:hypothetical protein
MECGTYRKYLTKLLTGLHTSFGFLFWISEMESHMPSLDQLPDIITKIHAVAASTLDLLDYLVIRVGIVGLAIHGVCALFKSHKQQPTESKSRQRNPIPPRHKRRRPKAREPVASERTNPHAWTEPERTPDFACHVESRLIVAGKRIRRTARRKDPLLTILRRELGHAEEIAKEFQIPRKIAAEPSRPTAILCGGFWAGRRRTRLAGSAGRGRIQPVQTSGCEGIELRFPSSHTLSASPGRC